MTVSQYANHISRAFVNKSGLSPGGGKGHGCTGTAYFCFAKEGVNCRFLPGLFKVIKRNFKCVMKQSKFPTDPSHLTYIDK